MSTKGTWLDDELVFLDDAHGRHTHFPARYAHTLLQHAKADDDGIARWALRPFHRDVLQGVVDLLDQRDACTHTDKTGDCEQAAVFDLANKRPRCETHPTEA